MGLLPGASPFPSAFVLLCLWQNAVYSWNSYVQPAAQQQLLRLEGYLLFLPPLIAWLICVTNNCNPCNPTALSLCPFLTRQVFVMLVVVFFPPSRVSALHTGGFPTALRVCTAPPQRSCPLEASKGYQIKKPNTPEVTLPICLFLSIKLADCKGMRRKVIFWLKK